METDPLTDVLRDTGLARRLLDLSAISPALALRFPCERSIGLHLVVRGPLYLHAPGLPEPLRLGDGDIALMARGCDHVLSTEAQLDGLRIEPIGSGPPLPDAAVDAASCVVISGAYQLWNKPLHPFFAEMPAWSVLRAADRPRLGPTALATGLIESELRASEAGRAIVVHALFDVLFTFALREVTAQCARTRAGWSQAMGDAPVRRAVALMHDDCAHPWTLDELAQRVGLSRTALAERFRAAMGDTPLNHLRTLRMQRAMRLLGDTTQNLERIAAAVGYQDAFGFSKVFKRTVGVSPKEFRRRDAAERADPFRFHGT